MSTKSDERKPVSPPLRDAGEASEPRSGELAGAATDASLKRNAEAINAIADKGDAEFDRGEYVTLDQVLADIEAQRQRRQAKRA